MRKIYSFSECTGLQRCKRSHNIHILKDVFHDASVRKVIHLQQRNTYVITYIKNSISQDAILPLVLHTQTDTYTHPTPETNCDKAVGEPEFSGKCFCSFSLNQAPPCWQIVISGGRLYHHRHWNLGLLQQGNSKWDWPKKCVSNHAEPIPSLRTVGVQLHGLVCCSDLCRVSSGSLFHSLLPLRISLSSLLFSSLPLSACAAHLFVSFFCSSLSSDHPALYSRNFFAECKVTVRKGMVSWGTQQRWDAQYFFSF